MPRLTHEREIELIAKARAGCPRARDALVLAHMPLARAIARRYFPLWDPSAHDDIAQAAALGVIYAVDRHDPDTGHRLATFLGYAVRAAARQAALSHRCIIGPTSSRAQFRRPAVSLNRPVPGREDGEVIDLLPDHDSPSPYDNAETSTIIRKIRAALETLPERERIAVEARFLDDQEMETIGAMLGCTREGARQIINRGLRRLRPHIEALAPQAA